MTLTDVKNNYSLEDIKQYLIDNKEEITHKVVVEGGLFDKVKQAKKRNKEDDTIVIRYTPIHWSLNYDL